MLYQQYLVIDYGTTYIKGMLFKEMLGSITILRSEKLSIVNLKGSEEDEYEYNLVRFIQSFFPEEKTFFLNIPTEKIIIRDLQVPFGNQKTVMEVMSSEVESVIPFPIETMSIQGTIWKLTEENSNVITFSAHETDVINSVEPLVKEQETQVKSLYTDLYSIAAIVKTHHQKTTNYETEAQLDLGGKISIFNACSQGKLFHSRYFFKGGHHITEKIADTLQMSHNEAEQLKISIDFNIFTEEEAEAKQRSKFLRMFNLKEEDYASLKAIILEVLEEIAEELERSLQVLPIESVPQVVHISGGSSSFPGIETVLSERLEIPFRRYDFLEIEQIDYVNCLGASYQQKFNKWEKVDFLTERLAKKINVNTFNFAKFQIHFTLTLISLIILLTVFLVGIIIDQKKIKKNQLALKEKYEKGFRTKLKGKDAAAAAISKVNKEKKKSEIVRLFLDKENILDLIDDISNRFPDKESSDFVLDQFTFNGNNIQLFIRVAEFSDIGALQSGLEKSLKFMKVEVQNKRLIQGAKKYKVSFKFKLELKVKGKKRKKKKKYVR
ncbi:MAG: pilus assembly protein PilM [Spirochaetota bacterium]